MGGGATSLLARGSGPAGSPLDRILARSPLQPLSRLVSRRSLRVLAYHDITDPQRFGEHLDFLGERHDIVSIDEVVAAVRGDHGLPAAACLITFDDADRTIVDHALPALARRGMAALAFVVTGLLGTSEPFWWEEVLAAAATGSVPAALRGRRPEEAVSYLKCVPDGERRAILVALRAMAPSPPPSRPHLTRDDLIRLVAGGVAIGSHSVTHPCLDRCTDDEIRHQITVSDAALDGVRGSGPRVFAYPNGDQDTRVRQALDEAGYDAAFLFDHRLAAVPPADRLRIPRLRVNSWTSIDRLAIITSGLHPAIHRMRGGS